MTKPDGNTDIDSFWEYSDPALSEQRFRSALENAQGDVRLELLTQVARTYSLRGQFGEAHKILDEVEHQLGDAGVRPQVRYLLERGRTFNSAGEKEKASQLFIKAWDQALAAGYEGLAVDAAHMAAITYSGTPEAVVWNQRGLAVGRTSNDPKAAALVPAMLNNTAWDLHEMGRFDEALKLFEEAQAAWTERGKPAQIRIAKWSVGRCLRSMGRNIAALVFLRDLEAEHMAEGSADGYVFEEIAENLEALGNVEEASPYFERAYIELSQDEWLVKNEPERLSSLQKRASKGTT